MTVTTTMTAPPLPEDLTTVLKRMRMPYLRAAAPDVLATAKAQRWDPTEVLRVLLAEEVRGGGLGHQGDAPQERRPATPGRPSRPGRRPPPPSPPRPSRRWRPWNGSTALRTSPSAGPPAPGRPTSSRRSPTR